MTATHKVDVAVVGAGPAGLSAALAARSLGVSVLVIDEYAIPGGQYYRQRAKSHPVEPDSADESTQMRAGRQLAQAVEQAGAEIWRETMLWAAYPDRVLAVDRAGASIEVHAQRVIIASGAHDRVIPFPGWTLPGVMTVGAAQTLLKAHGVVAGQRMVVAGSGPFLLVVALELARAGVRVEVIEAARPNLRALAGFLRFPSRWGELARLLAGLLAHRVPIRMGRAVTRAEGSAAVTVAVSQRLDPQGKPLAGTERRHEIDALAVANGFRVQAEVARLMGCETRYDEAAGGHVVATDKATGKTSVEDVYAAGEITGVAGHEVASAEGSIAGLCAASSLEHARGCDDQQLSGVRARRHQAQAFADLVAHTFAPAPGLTALTTSATMVCRCEAVTRGAIEEAIDAGALTTSAVKRWTRCGMGPCQGRMCGWPLARILSQRLNLPLSEVENLTARLPIKPIALGDVIEKTSRSQ